jgi:hypothetical protein
LKPDLTLAPENTKQNYTGKERRSKKKHGFAKKANNIISS